MTEQAKKLRERLGSSRAESHGDVDQGESGPNSFSRRQTSYKDVRKFKRHAWEAGAPEPEGIGGVVNIRTSGTNQHTFRDPDQMVNLRRSSRGDKHLRTSKRSSKLKPSSSSIEGRKESRASRGRTDESSIIFKEGGGI